MNIRHSRENNSRDYSSIMQSNEEDINPLLTSQATATHEDCETRRRRMARESQKRYRQREKQKITDTQKRIQELKVHVAKWTEYHDLLNSQVLMRPTNHIVKEYKIMEIYAQVVRHGAMAPGTSEGDLQLRFFRVHFTPDMIFQAPEFPTGPDFFYQQWEQYSVLHPKHCAQMIGIDMLHQHLNLVCISFHMTMPIKHRTILALYPHMANHPEFVQKVVGKALKYTLKLTFRFNNYNLIEKISFEDTSTAGWLDILGDMELVIKVIAGRQMKELVIITPEQDIIKAIQQEAALLVQSTTVLTSSSPTIGQNPNLGNVELQNDSVPVIPCLNVSPPVCSQEEPTIIRQGYSNDRMSMSLILSENTEDSPCEGNE